MDVFNWNAQSTLRRIPGIKEEDAIVKAMASLMNANDWPVPDTQKAMFTMLKDGTCMHSTPFHR